MEICLLEFWRLEGPRSRDLQSERVLIAWPSHGPTFSLQFYRVEGQTLSVFFAWDACPLLFTKRITVCVFIKH